MKRVSILSVCLVAVAALAAAQDKVTVPLSSPEQPATLKAHLISGSITVTIGTGSQVVIESQPGALTGVLTGRGDRDRNVPPGMHRIDGGGHGFNVEEDHNVVTVSPDMGGIGTNLTIQVPVNTSLSLKTINGGHIDVTGVSGDIDVQNINGEITLKNVSGSVSASTMNGSPDGESRPCRPRQADVVHSTERQN